MRSLFWIPVTLLLAFSCREQRVQYPKLDELDGYIAARPVYETRKRDQLEGIWKLAAGTQSARRLCDYSMYAAEEYFSYNFDSTQVCLKKSLELAEQIRDTDRYNRAAIMLGHLYAKSGHYMEAYNRLMGQIDTSTLSEALKVDYLLALYDFSRDLAGNSGMVERPPLAEQEVYRTRLYALLPKDSERWRQLKMDELASAGRLAEADSVGHLLIAGTQPQEHQYAIYAYELSEIAERMGRQEERMDWLIKSAECDILNAVKDYASLTLISQIIIHDDVERSFRYLRVAQEDAIFYNAKLRPWQISQFFMGIEDSYSARQARLHRAAKISSMLLAALTFLLLLLAWFLVARSRKLTQLSRELEESNRQLAEANSSLGGLNKELSRADHVKERYIVDFLRRFSANVSFVQAEDSRARNMLKQGKAEQLLRELSLSTRTEKSLKEFYRTFDSTFLQAICPDFVDRFNELLREDARFSPKPGSLNTELRIFALIRLGVDDSREIAELLHYSASTIYNYKVSVKNAALGDRDRFEEAVKKIGK